MKKIQKKTQTNKTPIRVVKSTYYSNWGDRIGYPLASVIVKPLAKISFLTPNHVTLISFALFALGCIFLILEFPNHLIIGGLMIFFGYVGDDVDGQLARITKKYSIMGDYMDKVLDILKIFLITFFTGLAVYLQTGNVLYLILGFIACFMFQYRYYIKLESMFSAYSNNPKYFDESSEKRKKLEHEMDVLYAKKAKTIGEAFKISAVKNRTLLLVDEAEFAIFVAIGAIVNRLDVVLWILAIAQTSWALWRVFERGGQLKNKSGRLLWPMRK
jgi:phosphatidylglycerophosphate synthase